MTDPYIRRVTLTKLKKVYEHHGYLPDHPVAILADHANVAPRTVRRWWASYHGTSNNDGDDRFELDTDMLEVLAAHNGKVAPTYHDLHKAGYDLPSLSTFRRRVNDLDTATTAYFRGGAEQLRNNQLYIRFEAEERNRLWYIDHQEIPVWMIPNGHKTPVKPWMTTVMDDKTRYVLAYHITFGRPSSSQAVATIADAVRLKPLDVPGEHVGGVPGEVTFDNAAEFVGDHFQQALRNLGIAPKPHAPYSPMQSGKLERWHRTSQDEFFSTLPGYSQGAATWSGTELFKGPNDQMLHEQLFLTLLAGWIDEYNTQRHHSAIDKTPQDSWLDDRNIPLTQVDPMALRHAMLKTDRPRKVTKDGINFNSTKYIAPTLAHHVNRTVEVRHMPHDETHIEVFLDGNWLCTAVPHDALTKKQKNLISKTRRDQYDTARQIQQDATQRRRLRAHNTKQNNEENEEETPGASPQQPESAGAGTSNRLDPLGAHPTSDDPFDGNWDDLLALDHNPAGTQNRTRPDTDDEDDSEDQAA